MPTAKSEAKLTATPDSDRTTDLVCLQMDITTFGGTKRENPCLTNDGHSDIHRGKTNKESLVIPNEAPVEAMS